MINGRTGSLAETFFPLARPNGRRWLFPFVPVQVKRFLDGRRAARYLSFCYKSGLHNCALTLISVSGESNGCNVNHYRAYTTAVGWFGVRFEWKGPIEHLT